MVREGAAVLSGGAVYEYAENVVAIGLVQAHHETDGAEPMEIHKGRAIENTFA